MVQGKAKWFKEKRGFISSQSPMLSTKLYALSEAATPYVKLIVTVPPLSPDVIDLRDKNAENFISGAKHTESRYQAKTIWESWYHLKSSGGATLADPGASHSVSYSTGRHITRHRPQKRWEKQHRLTDRAAVKVHSVDGTYRAVPSRSLTAPRPPHNATLLTAG
ncbi:hypothetical protein BDP67DRAFT_495248 [Colletotrichum lupini]|nr:hypothetical protein BDP67DRAFT_495248 [Colletotrichum lupini]